MPVKKTVAEKKVKENKKSDGKTFAKKKVKEIVEVMANSDIDRTSSFKRNLRPRRSSTMLDDYIITDSEEDENCEFISEVNKNETPKPAIKVSSVGDSKLPKCILSTEESVKKNLKINKTDLKPKKDLNKMDSEVKKSLSETKSKNILLKCDKEPEIKNNKYATVDKKTEKLSKNKTEIVVITKEPKTSSEGSKKAGKKVPPPNNLQQKAVKKGKVSKKKNSSLDVYNNNNKKQSTSSSSSVVSSSSSIFSDITSHSKEELLECMAANFDAKSTASEDTKKSTNKVSTMLSKVKDNAIVLLNRIENDNTSTLLQQNQNHIPTSETMFREKNAIKKKKVENSTEAFEKKEENSTEAFEKKEDKSDTIVDKIEDHIEKKVESLKAVKLKQELKAVSKIENVVVAKEENVLISRKEENVVLVVDRVEKTESIVVPFNKVEKVENIVFQTIAKDLFHGQQKEIKITMPEFFSGKDFQLPNRFKPDDGLSVLSEICSALPRFNEPFVPNGQLLNKLPTTGESSFVKYAPPPISNDEKKEEKLPLVSTLTPPSFESRTMKIVNLARGTKTVDGTNEKKDLSTSWRQAFKDVKLPINGLSTYSTTQADLTKKKNNRTLPQKTYSDDVNDGSNGEAKEVITDNGLVKTTLPPSLVNGCIVESKLGSSQPCQKTICSESKTIDVLDGKKAVANNSSYLAKRTILNSTKYDLKFEKRSATAVVPTAALVTEEKQLQRKDVSGDVSSSDDLSPEKKIFHQRRLSTNQSCSGNSSDAFSPDNETSVYAFQPDLPVASTPFRRNKPQSPAKSRTVSPNTSISVSICTKYVPSLEEA